MKRDMSRVMVGNKHLLKSQQTKSLRGHYKSLPNQYSKGFWKDVLNGLDKLTGLDISGHVGGGADFLQSLLNIKVGRDITQLYEVLINKGVGADVALAIVDMMKNAVLRDLAMGINRKLNKPDVKMILEFLRKYKRSLKKVPGGMQFLGNAAKEILKANEQWGDEWKHNPRNLPPEDLW